MPHLLHSAADPDAPPTEPVPNKLDNVLDQNEPAVQAYLKLRKRNQRLFIIVGIILIAFIVGWVLWRLAARSGENANQLDEQQQLIDKLAVQVDSAIQQGADVSTPEQVANQVNGAQPTPAGVQGERGEAGPVGPAGPAGVVSQEAVATAVASYCAQGGPNGGSNCRGFQGDTGPQGATGAQGPAPTEAQVAQAISAYCANGACIGPQGAVGPPGPTGATGGEGPTGQTGTQGASGADGSNGSNGNQGDPGPAGPQGEPGATGAAGPGPTPEQISAAVTEFCANNACATGPQGPAGATGAQGPAGPAGPQGATPTNLSCTPSNTADLSQPWTCTAA